MLWPRENELRMNKNIEGIDATAYFLSAIKPNSLLPQMLRIAAKSTEANQDRIHLMYML